MRDLRAICNAATEGPWGWYGDLNFGPYLATRHGGRRFVMQFARLGKNGGQPRFQVYDEKTGWGHMVDGVDLAIREVEYRDDIVGFDNPDATFIETFDPEMVGKLLDIVQAAQAVVDSPYVRDAEAKTVQNLGGALAALDTEDN